MRWDVFCRVIDNYGDIGVCWRLCRALAERDQMVRLWVDDASALGWMAPSGRASVEVHAWSAAENSTVAAGDVVIEAFGCDPPAGFVGRMAARSPAPVWIHRESLSAEDYVERSHGLASPQGCGAGQGLTKWFYYPGYTAATGGLLRSSAPREAPSAWLAAHGWAPRPGERTVLVFCYPGAPLDALVPALGPAPTQLLCAPGTAAGLVERVQASPHLRARCLPHLPQVTFDELLHCTDLNLVRGEDSFVQAQWAAVPFIWQPYVQPDGVHLAKLDAFLDRFVAASGLAAPHAGALRQLWHAWSGAGPWPGSWPDESAWRCACLRWRAGLLAQADLAGQLIQFAREKARILGFASTGTEGTKRD